MADHRKTVGSQRLPEGVVGAPLEVLGAPLEILGDPLKVFEGPLKVFEGHLKVWGVLFKTFGAPSKTFDAWLGFCLTVLWAMVSSNHQAKGFDCRRMRRYFGNVQGEAQAKVT